MFEGSEYFGQEAASITLGLVGLGRVGREVAARARALGFTVLAYDPLVTEAADGVALVPLDTLLDRCDIVSVHARATAENRHMFSRSTFTRMRPGAYFINTARESLVDEAALGEALEEGILAGAALDVLERPKPSARHPLLDAPNVLVTPHIGGATAETLARGARRAVAAVASLVDRAGARRRGEPAGAAGQECDDMTSRYLLAIDAGTGSCRAVLFTEAGRQAAVSVREWAHHEPPGVPGGQDFDVESGWRAIAACVQDALRAAGASGADVAAVAATSMREGVVLYDRAGHEIWACPNVDSRSAEEAADLVREGAAEKIYAEAGDWVSITTPARLRWLARHRPDILDATGSLGMLSDWIVYRLSGAQVTEPSCGSSSGMFTLAQRTWSASIPALCGLPA